MILQSQNLSLAGNYLKSRPGSDASQRYYNGEVYKSSFFSRLRMFFSIGGFIDELKAFYPYQRVIVATAKQYENESEEVWKNSLLTSAASVFLIFNLAKRGYVLPIFSKYGKVFGTHRILRHYVCATFLPYVLLSTDLRWKYLNHVEHFWAIHSRRMNNKMTQDPSETMYPPQMKARNLSGVWRPAFVDPTDLQTKWDNETDFMNAPAFQIPQYAEPQAAEQQQGEKVAIDFSQPVTYRQLSQFVGITDEQKISEQFKSKLDDVVDQSDPATYNLIKAYPSQQAQADADQ